MVIFRVNSEELNFSSEEVFYLNMVYGSLSDAETYGVKILSKFPGSPILEKIFQNFHA